MFKYPLRGKVHRDVERQLTLIIDKLEGQIKATAPLIAAGTPNSPSQDLLRPVATPLLGDATATDPVLQSIALGVKGVAVTDATGAGDVVTQLNALLASLRAIGVIAI